MKFKNILKQIRKANCLTAKYLANEIGLTPAAISQFENGVREPSIKSLIKIADYFDVTTDYLIGRNINPKIKQILISGEFALREIK